MNLFRRLQRGFMAAAALTLLFSAQTMAEAETETEILSEAAYEEIDDEILLAADGLEFEDLEVAASNAFAMSVTSEDADPEDGLTWKLHFENRTDEDLSVSFANTAINGWMCPTDEWGTTGWSIAAGEETDTEVQWTADALEMIGADAVDTVSFALKAYSLKDGEYKYYANSVATIDFGTDDATGIEVPEELDVIMDNSEYHFGILEYDTDESGMPLWTVYLKNDSDAVSLFEIKNTVLNGYASDPYWSEIILPGFRSITKINFWNLDLEDAGIGTVTEASFKIRVWKEASTGYNSYVDPTDTEGSVTIETESVSEMETEEAAADEFADETILYDENDVTLGITKIGYADDQSYYAIGLHLVNNSDTDLKASVDAIRVNGKDTYQDWSRDLAAETWLTGLIPVDGKMLERMKVDDVLAVSMDFVLTDKEGNEIANETYQLTGDDSEFESDLEDLTEVVLQEEEQETLADVIAETEAVETEVPETEAPETEAPETQAPETEAPETEAPETEAPETEAPETEAPETEAPETEAPETEAPETEAPETEAETEAATLPAVDEQEETEEEEVPVVVFTDEKTVRLVQAVLATGGVELEKDGKITDALKEAIAEYRSTNGLSEGTDIDDELLFKMGITDSDTLQKIQEALNGLGYDCGEPDGLTGRKTNDAIALYRKDHDLNEGEGIDEKLIEELGITRSVAGEETETESETGEPETADAETEEAAKTDAKEFTDENTVRIVQAALNANGFELDKDGLIGDNLRTAISRYREDKGLAEGTVIDDELLFSLGITDSETLKKVQEALNGLGYDCGDPDGLTGKKTTDAIDGYREKEGLKGSGIDQALLDALKISR